MSSEPSPAKWRCDYCTYENWPSSLKCVMCRGAKPLLNEDIYKLRDESPPLNLSGVASGTSQQESRPKNGIGKWECQACTLLNWPRAVKCSECETPRPCSETNLHDQLQSLHINNDLSNTMSTSTLPNTSHIDKKEAASDARRPVTEKPVQRRQGLKWICSVCTYENWPKSSKCVMCGSAWSNDCLYIAGPNQCNNTAGTRSPPGSRSIAPSPELETTLLSTARGGVGSSQISLLEDNSQLRRSTRRSERNQATCDLAMATNSPNNCEYSRNLKQMRQLKREADLAWLNACLGVVEGDLNSVEAYLSAGGDPARQLSPSEVTLLNRPSAFDTGYTLVHLAIRFHREDMLATLLSQIEGSGSGLKRVPSYVAPDLAAEIRRHVASTVRQRKGSFPCQYVTELATFALPAEVEDLVGPIQEQLFDELLDKDAQQQLESDPAVLNWSLDVTVRLGSRLYALWNRSAGDCLLDSVMQATWGVFDRENTLRRALSDSLHQGGHLFYPRWKEYESIQAHLLDFTLEDGQWEEDWAALLSLAGQPGSSLEQLHVFTLAHVLRRPIVIYGVKYVKSFRGEAIGYARFQGVYLPLLWEPSFCIRSPLALGYTRGHFTALVPIEPYSRILDGNIAMGLNNHSPDDLQVTFLPLMDQERKLLPLHFLTASELGREETILRQWLDVCVTEGGILVAQQRLHKRPLPVAQMLEEWLNHYRRLANATRPPFSRTVPVQDFSSDGGETDDE